MKVALAMSYDEYAEASRALGRWKGDSGKPIRWCGYVAVAVELLCLADQSEFLR